MQSKWCSRRLGVFYHVIGAFSKQGDLIEDKIRVCYQIRNLFTYVTFKITNEKLSIYGIKKIENYCYMHPIGKRLTSKFRYILYLNSDVKRFTKQSFSYGISYIPLIQITLFYFLGSTGKRAIAAAIADYHKYTCLRFTKISRGTGNHISFYNGRG